MSGDQAQATSFSIASICFLLIGTAISSSKVVSQRIYEGGQYGAKP